MSPGERVSPPSTGPERDHFWWWLLAVLVVLLLMTVPLLLAVSG